MIIPTGERFGRYILSADSVGRYPVTVGVVNKKVDGLVNDT